MKKVVLVTGSAKGIGKQTIKEFAKNDYNVVINYLTNEKKAKELKEYIEKEYKVEALLVEADITDEENVKSMIDLVLNKFGRIDVLVNNACYTFDEKVLEKTKEQFMRVLEVNLVGTFLMCKHVLQNTVPECIINVSSTDSIDTYNPISIDYCTSKAGINLLTKILKEEFPMVKICAILPNWVDTESVKEMNAQYLKEEMKRIGQKELIKKEDVAKKIYDIVHDKNIKSGDLIIMDGK